MKQCSNVTIEQESAFTLIEVMLALGIIVVLSTVGFLNLSSFLGSRYVRTGLEETSSVLLEARTRATTGQDGQAWGVRLSSSDNPRRYELFFGSSYDPLAVEQTYFLSRGVKFSEPSAGVVFDALFRPVFGTLPSAKVLSLHGGGGGILGDLILHAPGFLTTRLENDVFGYWHLDQGAGSAVPDASPSSFHGLVSGAVWQGSSECKAGGCLYFDGSSDNASGAFSRSLSSFSILGWVRLQGS
ncbi:MAG: prepilin-type N-terminal cleavage/methylation domain-containing protein, partial [Candidatus Wolfebacteria bacterium]|nr:prepilin-type N-terminal cleavage/methylation domain-containing protein [Candidatus Wolfebacteria bacterium]